VRITAGGDVARRGAGKPYVVQAGKSVGDAVRVHATKRVAPGVKLTMTIGVTTPGDANTADDAVTATPTVLGVGDSYAFVPRGRARLIHGVATPGHGPASARLLRVTRVSIAVRRLGHGCRWLSSTKPRFRLRKADAKGRCPRPVWLRAKGKSRWQLTTKGLPAGRYVLLSRATIGAGFSEASFSPKDHNEITFRVGR